MIHPNRCPRAALRALTLVAVVLGAVPVSAQVATDLTIDSFTVAAPQVDVFQPLQVSVFVRNAGDVPLQNVAIRLSYSERTATPVLQQMTVLQLSSVNLAGQQSIGLNWSEALPPGDYRLFAEVDPENAIAETDEANNSQSIDVRVRPIEISPDVLAAIRERVEPGFPAQPLGPFAVFETVSADLYPELQRYFGWGGSGHGNVGAIIRNGGPDAIPVAVLDLVTVSVEFVGAVTDGICSVPLTGLSQGALWSGGSVTVNFYTDASGPCPRAKVPDLPCDPDAEAKQELSFRCLQVPELRLSLDLPESQDLFGTGYYLADPRLYNNVEIVPAGLH